jgi:hypothetical protein
MASYKYPNYLVQDQSAEFDREHHPGQTVPYSGIYMCMGCGKEIASNEGQPFPPQNHHQHTIAQGHVRWKLITYADHKPK